MFPVALVGRLSAARLYATAGTSDTVAARTAREQIAALVGGHAAEDALEGVLKGQVEAVLPHRTVGADGLGFGHAFGGVVEKDLGVHAEAGGVVTPAGQGHVLAGPVGLVVETESFHTPQDATRGR